MPVIEHKLAASFVNCEKKKIKKDTIRSDCSSSAWYYRGNLIAWKQGNFVQIKDVGWRTETTKRRLNAIFKRCNIPLRIFKKKGSWYIGENCWYGSYSFYIKET